MWDYFVVRTLHTTLKGTLLRQNTFQVTMLNGCQIIGLDAIGWQIKNVNRRIRYDAPEQVCYKRISFTDGLLNLFQVHH